MAKGKKGKCRISGPYKSKAAAQRARKGRGFVARRKAWFVLTCPKPKR